MRQFPSQGLGCAAPPQRCAVASCSAATAAGATDKRFAKRGIWIGLPLALFVTIFLARASEVTLLPNSAAEEISSAPPPMHHATAIPHDVVFTTFMCPPCSPLRSRIENNTRHVWSNMAGVKFVAMDPEGGERNPDGLPTLRSMYGRAIEEFPDARTYTYLNADIIGTRDFVEAIDAVSNLGDFLMVGRRTEVPWNATIDVRDPGFDFDAHLRRGEMAVPNAVDYFVVTRDAIDWGSVPPLVVGRPAFDAWLVDHVYHRPEVALVDATRSVPMIHQSDGERWGSRGDGSPSTPNLLYNKKWANNVKNNIGHGTTEHARWETEKIANGTSVLNKRWGISMTITRAGLKQWKMTDRSWH